MNIFRIIKRTVVNAFDDLCSQLDGPRRARCVARLERLHERRRDKLVETSTKVDDQVWVFAKLLAEEHHDVEFLECYIKMMSGTLRREQAEAHSKRATLRAEEDEEDGEEDDAVRQHAHNNYLTIRAFLENDEDNLRPLLENVDPDQQLELRRMRDLYLRGAWAASGLSQQDWATIGIKDPSTARALQALGVCPTDSILDATLNAREIAALFGAFGPHISVSPLDLLNERWSQGATCRLTICAFRYSGGRALSTTCIVSPVRRLSHRPRSPPFRPPGTNGTAVC